MSKDALDNLMGLAAVRGATGHDDEAIKLLKEVIRQAPRKAEPYLRISEIVENTNLAMAMEYKALYCNLVPKPSCYDWEHVGDMAVQLRKFKNAVDYFGKAINCDKTNWLLYEKRIKYLEELGYKNDAMKLRLQAAMNVDHIEYNLTFESLQEMIKSVAEYYTNSNNDVELIVVLKAHIKRSKQFNVHFLEELLTLIDVLSSKFDYFGIIETILCFCDGIRGLDDEGKLAYSFSDECKISNFPSTSLVEFEVSPAFPTKILCLLIAACVKKEYFDYAKLLLPNIFTRRASEDLAEKYVQIVSAYSNSADIDTGLQTAAKLLTNPMFQSHAEMYFYTGFMYEKQLKFDEAVRFYKTAISMNDTLVDAKVSLSCILQNNGDMEGALEALKNADIDASHRIPDEKLLLRQLELLELPKEQNQYIRVLRMLLAPYFYEILKDEQWYLMCKPKENCLNTALRRVALKMLNKSQLKLFVLRIGLISTQNHRELQLSQIDLKNYSVMLIMELYKADRYLEMLCICCFAAIHPKTGDSDLCNALFFAAAKTENFKFCQEFLRTKILSLCKSAEPDLRQLFQMMNYFLGQEYCGAIIKFLRRINDKFPTDATLLMIAANHSNITSSYKAALSTYYLVDKYRPNDPLVTLMTALSLISLSCKRSITNRRAISMRGISILGKYQRLRRDSGPMQEVYYNIGRVFQQLGLGTHAVYWYERVLEEPDLTIYRENKLTGDLDLIPSAKYDLKCAAAYNLVCLIRELSPQKAKSLLRRYCVLGN